MMQALETVLCAFGCGLITLLLKHESNGFLAIFSQSMNDENYAVNHLKFMTDSAWDGQKALWVNWLSMFAWTSANMVGTLVAIYQD